MTRLREKRITVIEDDPDLRSLVGLALETSGYQVSMMEGWQAGEQQISDVYIIDINLANGSSGIDICKELKSQAESRPPLVILISANPDLRRMALEACADETLSKPFSTRELLEKVATLVRADVVV